MTYGLWALQLREINHSRWPVISMVPVVLAVLRYAVDGGNGGEPRRLPWVTGCCKCSAAPLVITLIAAVYL